MVQGKLFIISAPSGAGKTALVSAVIAQLKDTYHIQRVITYTCRSPRTGEIEGHDYHFISLNDFEKKIHEGFFLEWSGAYGTYYGSPVSIKEGLDRGVSSILIMDRVGVVTLSSLIPEAIKIWVSVPSMQVLEERLKKRGTETDERIQYRLKLAHQEIEAESHSPVCDVVIMNDNFEKTVATFKDFLQNTMKMLANQTNLIRSGFEKIKMTEK